MTRKGEMDLTSLADLGLTLYAKTEPSRRGRSKCGTSLADRVEATMGAVMQMTTVATDDNMRI